MARDAQALARFQREAQAASALNHPNICTIYDIGVQNGQAFIAMEFLDGVTRKHRIDAKPVETEVLLAWQLRLPMRWTPRMPKALSTATSSRPTSSSPRGAMSRFWISDSRRSRPPAVRRARLHRRARRSRSTSSISPARVLRSAPSLICRRSRARAKELDARSDLFSFGAVLYEVATGQLPFRGDSAATIFEAILNRAPIAPVRLNPEVPPELERIINKALEKDRNLRYQHALEMRADLQRLKRDSESGRSPAAGSGTVAVPEAAAARVAKLRRIVVPALLVALLVASSLYYRSRQSKRLTDKDAIVLTDFANSTGDGVFDNTLKTALNVSLRQSPFLNVLSDTEVAQTLQLMTRPASTKLTPEVARELCLRTGSEAYIAGSIGSLGREFVLGLKAVSCQSGDTLAEEQVTALSKEKVLDALGEAASNLRGELGESLATVQKFDVPLVEATTSSLEALQTYSRGANTRGAKDPAAALPYFQRAIEI